MIPRNWVQIWLKSVEPGQTGQLGSLRSHLNRWHLGKASGVRWEKTHSNQIFVFIMLVYISKVTNPFLNLAMENYIFTKSKESRILFLYCNEPCVVIGRNQNPIVECNLMHLQKHNIPVIRRYSGGGTVYHDLGNLNYSLMTPKSEFKRNKGVSFLKEALKGRLMLCVDPLLSTHSVQ